MPAFQSHRRRDLFRVAGGGLAFALADALQGRPPATAAVPGGQQLAVAQLTNPLDLDPWGSLIVNETDIMAHIIEPLTMLDRRGKLVPVVASGWKMVSP